MERSSSDGENPYRPPNAAPDSPAPPRSWLRYFLGIGCVLAGCVGILCVAAGLAVAAQVGDSPDTLMRMPRGRLLLLLLGGFAVGTARWFVAARGCFRGEWPTAITNATLGLGFVVGPLCYLLSRAAQ